MSEGTTRALGVCYYPEHWPEERWAEDARLMAATGLSHARIGEFAWSRIEPRPDVFDWAWLDRAVDTLAAHGLQVVMGTPSATPPRWMLDRHPDMLAVDRDGRPRKFGSRRHYCFSHEGYRREAARIAGLMAERYGGHAAIGAWQLDNEYGCHDTTLSYSAAAVEAFRTWLLERYGSIKALNEAWGSRFWSLHYDDFRQIEPPHLTVTEPLPTHALDFRRFSSEQVIRFNRALAEAVRPHAGGRPLLHNYMGRVLDFDHFALGAELDVASWDSYPLGFLEDRIEASSDWKRRFAHQGDPDFQAFHHDLYRAVGSGRLWVVEQQPGPVNWAPYNPDPTPGMVRLWTWEAFAHGAELVAYFRWRQAPFGQEQMHAGLLRPDATPAPALDEAREVAREIEARPRVGAGAANAALVFDYESVWAWSVQPQGQGFDYFDLVFATYRALRRAGLSIDVLSPETANVAPYRLVVVPALMRWRPALLEALRTLEGIALVGPRTGAKTEAMAIPERLPPDLPPDLLDLRVVRVETLRPDMPVRLERGGAFVHWREKVETGARVIERSADGWPAVVAEGRLRYLCGWADGTAMARLVRDAGASAGLDMLDLPDGLRVRDAIDGPIAVNYGAQPQPLGLHLGRRGFSGEIPAFGVAFADR